MVRAGVVPVEREVLLDDVRAERNGADRDRVALGVIREPDHRNEPPQALHGPQVLVFGRGRIVRIALEQDQVPG